MSGVSGGMTSEFCELELSTERLKKLREVMSHRNCMNISQSLRIVDTGRNSRRRPKILPQNFLEVQIRPSAQ